MSLFDRLFRSKKDSQSPERPGGLERQLQHLEARAKDALLGARGSLLNRAGDVCLKAGDRERALRYFGESIDCLLADEQPEPARGVAKKIIRVQPESVRTLCTLAWLDLAGRQYAAALSNVREYVEAVKRAGREEMAVGPLVDMAQVVRDTEFLQEAAKALEELGAHSKAELVREWCGAGGSPNAPQDPTELSAMCLKAASGSNELRRSEGAVA